MDPDDTDLKKARRNLLLINCLIIFFYYIAGDTDRFSILGATFSPTTFTSLYPVAIIWIYCNFRYYQLWNHGKILEGSLVYTKPESHEGVRDENKVILHYIEMERYDLCVKKFVKSGFPKDLIVQIDVWSPVGCVVYYTDSPNNTISRGSKLFRLSDDEIKICRDSALMHCNIKGTRLTSDLLPFFVSLGVFVAVTASCLFYLYWRYCSV